ncbi:MAG: methyltransferase domain-containing protein [Nitrospiraceae bacterium]|nr:methyltransferase domain-containing protein [Nitrospiraceae bacterium]
MKHLQLKPREDRRLLRGHLWAYRNEFAQLPEAEDGEVVDVFGDSRRLVGRGFYQREGGIAVRILDRRQPTIDGKFLAGHLARARLFRERLFPGQDVYRWVFGETDGLPGFVADRYGSVVACATPCAFYTPFADDLAKAFLSHDGVEGVRVVIRGHVHTFGEVPDTIECTVDGIRMGVDLSQGQKTGLFLDQRANSLAARPFMQGGRVLDGHCYVGQWSCHAAAAGAQQVLGVDTSEAAIELARANAERNGAADVCGFERADVMEILSRGDRYDCVLLDPPAFAKSRAQQRKALSLYQSLNRAGMEAVEPGGILVTSSCSHFVTRDAFLETLKRAANAARRQVWILDVRGAAPDHPVLMAMPETDYLTCATLRVL